MRAGLHYVEDERDPRGWREVDVLEWAAMFEDTGARCVASTTIYRFGVQVWISTVFMGLDHQWGNGPPLLYETMAFGGPEGQDYEERETNRVLARWTHDIVVQRQRDLSRWAWAVWFVGKATAAIAESWVAHKRAMGLVPPEPSWWSMHRELKRIVWWWQVTDRWPHIGTGDAVDA